MRLAELDYPLPEALIAQAPAPERAAARLLVLDRGGAPLRHAHVGDLPGFLRAGGWSPQEEGASNHSAARLPPRSPGSFAAAGMITRTAS